MADSTPEHAKALNEGISGFMVKPLKAIAGLAPDGLHVGLPHRAQAPLRIYEDALGARITCGAGDSLTLSFDAAWLDRPNRVIGLLPGHHPQPANPVPLTPDSPWLDDAALLAAISRLFESIALSGPLSLVDTDLSAAHPEKVAELQQRVIGLARTMAPPLFYSAALKAALSAPLATPGAALYETGLEND